MKNMRAYHLNRLGSLDGLIVAKRDVPSASELIARRLYLVNPIRQHGQRARQQSSERLSTRECAVLSLVARGQTNKRVARMLMITPETVKSHLKRTFIKLGSKTRAEAVARATELGFLANSETLPISSYENALSIRGKRTSDHLQAVKSCVWCVIIPQGR